VVPGDPAVLHAQPQRERAGEGPAVARTVPRFVPAQALAVVVFAALQRVALRRAAPVAA